MLNNSFEAVEIQRFIFGNNRGGEHIMTDRNPRGEKRRRDGSGRGVGRPGGRRAGRNPNPCKSKRGMGKGKGQNR